MKNFPGLRPALKRPTTYLAIVACAFVLQAMPLPVSAANDSGPSLKGLSQDEALRLGEKMYRNGILPSGEPLQSIVKGDILDGSGNLTCVSCHLRSGFGSVEGTVRTPPIDGKRLYKSVSKFTKLRKQTPVPENRDYFRPAYTDETLARAIRTGYDPSDRKIKDIMPIYLMDDRDVEILVYYLKNLSTQPQPGITDTTLHFATIISDDVTNEDREAMLVPLQAFIKNWRMPARIARVTRVRAQIEEGTRPHELRTLSLSVWELKGPADTWRKQLEDYYAKDPVFAFLGGITKSEWEPIHRFCEDHKIPAVFPVTDFPVISETDWYTLYPSKGLYKEGETAAKYLHGREDVLQRMSVVQVFRKDRAGLALSKAFQETWTELGHEAPDSVALDREETLTEAFWKKLAEKHKHAVVLIWLDEKDFPALDSLSATNTRPDLIFASSGLLGHRLYTLPEKERASVYLTYPYTLPNEFKKDRASNAVPAADNKMPVGKQAIELKMQALFTALSGPLPRMRSYVNREFFLEQVENLPDWSMGNMRMSFGWGQRYTTKGCYVVQLSEGPAPVPIKKSEWVIY